MSESTGNLECRELSAEWKQPLLAFLNALIESRETGYFYPHAFSEEAVEKIIRKKRKDLYYVLIEGKNVLGYGMLRGWDEGYDIPSLGIAIHPLARKVGLGSALMHFLHGAARRKGAETIRLRVRAENVRAAKLYQALGYRFQSEEAGFLVGFLDIRGQRCE